MTPKPPGQATGGEPPPFYLRGRIPPRLWRQSAWDGRNHATSALHEVSPPSLHGNGNRPPWRWRHRIPGVHEAVTLALRGGDWRAACTDERGNSRSHILVAVGASDPSRCPDGRGYAFVRGEASGQASRKQTGPFHDAVMGNGGPSREEKRKEGEGSHYMIVCMLSCIGR